MNSQTSPKQSKKGTYSYNKAKQTSNPVVKPNVALSRFISKNSKWMGLALFSVAFGFIGLYFVNGSFATSTVAVNSGGSGGAYASQYNQSFTGGGYTSKYHLFSTGIDPQKPIGLVINLHGDGAYEFKNPDSTYALDADGNNGIVKVARDYNMITLAILTPDTKSGDLTWWYEGNGYADYVYALINNIYGRYNIDKSRIWFSGYSGGAQFITQYYLSKYGGSSQFIGGGALMFGGGDTPQSGDPQKGVVNPILSDVKNNFRLWWGSGTKDLPDGSGWNGGYDSAQKGEAYYKNIGFVSLAHYYPVGWCHSTSSSCTSFEEKFALYLKERLALAYPNGVAAPASTQPETTTPNPSTGSSSTTGSGSSSTTGSGSTTTSSGSSTGSGSSSTSGSGSSPTSSSGSQPTSGTSNTNSSSTTPKDTDTEATGETRSVSSGGIYYNYDLRTTRNGVKVNLKTSSTVDKVELSVWKSGYFTSKTTYTVSAMPDADGKSILIISQLSPRERYNYQLKINGIAYKDGRGTFRTR